jgi:hypothetical protein
LNFLGTAGGNPSCYKRNFSFFTFTYNPGIRTKSLYLRQT